MSIWLLWKKPMVQGDLLSCDYSFKNKSVSCLWCNGNMCILTKRKVIPVCLSAKRFNCNYLDNRDMNFHIISCLIQHVRSTFWMETGDPSGPFHFLVCFVFLLFCNLLNHLNPPTCCGGFIHISLAIIGTTWAALLCHPLVFHWLIGRRKKKTKKQKKHLELSCQN